jgi:hypothetical protein
VLPGLTVQAARTGVTRRNLPPRASKPLPPEGPLTAGRWPFIRRVNPRGGSNLRKADWKVSRRLAGESVGAPLDLRRERLEIYHRRSAKAKATGVQTPSYPSTDRVEQGKLEYRRRTTSMRGLKII